MAFSLIPMTLTGVEPENRCLSQWPLTLNQKAHEGMESSENYEVFKPSQLEKDPHAGLFD